MPGHDAGPEPPPGTIEQRAERLTPDLPFSNVAPVVSRVAFIRVALAVLVAGCGPGATPSPVPPGEASSSLPSYSRDLLVGFEPLPERFIRAGGEDSEARVALGRALYHDARLSSTGEISCASCHDLSRYGVDNLARSPGVTGELGGRNSPTVYNAAGQALQFWDGRAGTLEEQAGGPILNPIEMGNVDEAEAVGRIAAIPGYAPLFQAAYPGDADPIRFENIVDSIAAFEARLVTPSRFDALLRGDESALSDQEKTGLAVFVAAGCVNCHEGVNLGGAGLRAFEGAAELTPDDRGRFDVTGEPGDEYVFKVPMLRNITRTAPYLHDGSAATLPEALAIMGRHQLGVELEGDALDAVLAFLGSLEGELPPEALRGPGVLP